jgi:hypothetical protein
VWITALEIAMLSVPSSFRQSFEAQLGQRITMGQSHTYHFVEMAKNSYLIKKRSMSYNCSFF